MKAAFANRPLKIVLDGAEPDAKLLKTATSAFVRQTLDAPSLAEICFAEPPAESVKTLRFGAALTLSVDDDTVLFAGEITTLEHSRDGAQGHVVRVRAYDRLHRLRKKQRPRALADVRAGDVAATAASDLGVESVATDAGPTRRLAVQYEHSDLDFIVDLAREAGLHLYLDGDLLRLVTLAGEGEPIELKVGRELAKVRSVASIETLRRNVRAQAWNVLRTTVLDSTVSLARQDADEDMRSIDSSAFPDLGVRTLFNRVAGDASELEGYAQADLDNAASGEVVIEGAADGNAKLKPGCIVSILGLDDDVDGRFTVTEALHRFGEDEGYVTEFSTAPPFAKARSRAPLFTFGRVFDTADPEKLSRARAKLPLMGDLETDWMPVVAASAGKDKGFAVMPEDGDNVLILFPNGDPAYGIVLGGLYGESRAPGLADAGARPFVFRTANGQAFTLDSANALAAIETSGGDRFEMGPKGTKLHAMQDLTIEAPGRTVTIRAKAVEFEEG
ncbi:MAG TPA: phage baseplate assembly protein V [Rhizomicrobium sp.]|nr:phage baseplate assembly protein V [Rhizomicrobium sp.]